ncbi:MAG: putative Ig domain-containing protein [Deltaproteobacteria bacterium]|nr:putative Ig domain-containing protein [Deltaproteobacteria bacterium]
MRPTGWLWPFLGLLAAPSSAWAATDISAVEIRGPQSVVAGQDMTPMVRVVGVSDEPVAEAFRLALFLAPGGLREGAVPLPFRDGDDARLTFDAGGLAVVEPVVRVPPGLSGTFYLLAVVDPDDEIEEHNEFDNLAIAAAATTVRLPAPDVAVLSGRLLVSSRRVNEVVEVIFEVENRGETAARVRVEAALSRDRVVTTADPFIDAIDLSIAAGGRVEGRLVGELPSLPVGDYFVAVIADPEGTLDEVEETNNMKVLDSPLNIFEAALSLSDVPLPEATLGARYFAQMTPVGGDGHYRYAVVEGALPPGVVLNEAAGTLEGVPEATGSFSFTVSVASHALDARRAFAIEVRSTGLALEVVDFPIAEAALGFAYTAPLIASGGAPPYRWSALDPTRVPAGLEVSPSGALFGTPLALGSFSFDVRVEDADGAMARRSFAVRVSPGVTVLVDAEASSGTFAVGMPVDAQLQASGGQGPYQWREVSSPPPGLSVSDEGRLTGTPTRVGTWPFRLRVSDSGLVAQSDTAIIVVEVVDDSDFEITNTTLPQGVVREKYEVPLETTGGESPITWRLKPGDRLPDGFFLAQGGQGRSPDVAVLNGLSYYAFTRGFTIQATDAFGRRREMPLALNVVGRGSEEGSARDDDAGGCACVTAAPSPSALAAGSSLGSASGSGSGSGSGSAPAWVRLLSLLLACALARMSGRFRPRFAAGTRWRGRSSGGELFSVGNRSAAKGTEGL